MKNRDDRSVAACIFSEDRQEVLLIKRRDVPIWVLPGGGIDPGESPQAAIVREIKEETGFGVKIEKQIGEYLPNNRLTRQTYLFDCKVVSGQAKSSSETKEVKFFPLERLPPMPPPYPGWIEDGKKNLPYPVKKILYEVSYLKLVYYLLTHPILVARFLLSRMGLAINSY